MEMLVVGVALVAFDELGGLDEHAARAAGGVVDAAVEGFDDLDDQLDDGGGGEELAAFLPFGHGELAEEVFVDPAEGVAFDIDGDVVEGAEEADEGGVVDAAVVLREGAAQVFVVFLDGAHGVVDRLAEVGGFGEVQEGVVAGGIAQVEDAFGLVVVAGEGFAGVLGFEVGAGFVETAGRRI